jgi:hypothetical protein
LSTRRRRKEKKDWYGKVLIAIALIVVSFVFYYSSVVNDNIEKINKVTLCPTNVDIHHVILFDPSDELNFVQKKYLDVKFTKIVNEVSEGERVSVFVVDENIEKQFEPAFSVCRPRDGSNVNTWTENERRIKKAWKTKFEEPLSTVLNDLMVGNPAEYSPLMEMFQAIAISSFRDSDYTVKKLTIVSDMLHNTNNYSHYKIKPDFNAFSETAYFKRLKTDLNGVDISIYYVGREGLDKLQTKRHGIFWGDYFIQQGAKVKFIERIDG